MGRQMGWMELEESDPRWQREWEHKRLRIRFGIKHIERRHYGRVMALLAQLDAGKRLRTVDLVWFQTDGRTYWFNGPRRVWNRIEAEFFAEEWKHSCDPHAAARASGHWRKAGKPDDALEITAAALAKCGDDPKVRSALYTTRGGAMRDLNRLNDALALGQNAHALTPENYRPCTLLGAVKIEQRYFDEGLAWYKKAEELGAPDKVVDRDLQSVLQGLPQPDQQRLCQFLLSRDPVRYAWVKPRNPQLRRNR